MNPDLLLQDCNTYCKKQSYSPIKKHRLLTTLILLILCFSVSAQDTLIGLTSNGGSEGKGTVFSINTNGSAFTIVKGFPDWGRNPKGNLVRASDGNFYGMAFSGGAYNFGTIFKI